LETQAVAHSRAPDDEDAVMGGVTVVNKENQPALYAQIARLFTVPPMPARLGELLTYSHTERSGHGRLETRTLEAART
jgi:hypothetical protein